MIFNPRTKVWANSKFMIMKKVAALLLVVVSSFSCTVEESVTKNDINSELVPPTNDPKWDKNGVQGN